MLTYSWEASNALKKFLRGRGIRLEGGPGGWAEVVRVFKECKVCFVDSACNSLLMLP